MAEGPDPGGLEHQASCELVFQAQVRAVNVRITEVGKYDARQDGGVRVVRVPTLDVAGKSVGSRARRPGAHVRRRASVRRRRAVDRPEDARVGELRADFVGAVGTPGPVKGIEGRVPARVRQRVVNFALVRDAKSATQRGLAVAKYVVGEANARAEVVVVTRGKRLALSGREARIARLVVKAGGPGDIDEAVRGAEPLRKVVSGRKDEVGHVTVLIGVPRVEIVAQTERQGQARAHFPVVIDERSERNVPPPSDVAREVSASERLAGDRIDLAGIDARSLGLHLSRRKGEAVEKFV